MKKRFLSIALLCLFACAGQSVKDAGRPDHAAFAGTLPWCAEEGWVAVGNQYFDDDGKPNPEADLYCGGEATPVGQHSIELRGGVRKICWRVADNKYLCGTKKKILSPGDAAHGAIVYVVIDEKPADDPAYATCNYMLRDLVDGAVYEPHKIDSYKARYRCREFLPTLADAEVLTSN